MTPLSTISISELQYLRSATERHIAHVARLPLKLRGDILDCLPNRIVDVHAHCGSENVIETFPSHLVGHILSTPLYWPAEAMDDYIARMFPGKDYVQLQFCMPFSGVEFNAANAYLLRRANSERKFVSFWCPAISNMCRSFAEAPQCIGIKGYHRACTPPSATIREFLPDDALHVAWKRKIPVIIHLPTRAELAIPELTQIASDFPGLRKVLAHCAMMDRRDVGSGKLIDYFRNDQFAFVDTSMVQDVTVLDATFRMCGSSRIMYGSDLPYSSFNCGLVEGDAGTLMKPDIEYPWSKSFGMSPDQSSYLSMCVLSLLTCCQGQGNAGQVLSNVFAGNAERIFNLGSHPILGDDRRT